MPVTILFTDLVDSTELLDRLGDAAAYRLWRGHFAVLRAAVAAHAGTEVKSLGDGLMVAFDEPADALACADAMLRAVARGDDRMQLRIGIALGEAMRDGDDYFGRPVVVARRLCDSAQPGEVLLCDATSDALAPRAARRLQPRGLLVLKGLRDPVRASALGV
jgi:class 3 adenylate cyclase